MEKEGRRRREGEQERKEGERRESQLYILFREYPHFLRCLILSNDPNSTATVC